ncbi:MAG TPA: DUF1697 domain-containing protein [Actinomycetota bacterium]|nr:DUF1697 domain-containing protein [Actinomycetota bacterium]
MTTYLALLRGINVGGRNKVPMAELRTVFGSLGLERVRTYVQSGNVVFESRSISPKRIAVAAEQAISEAFGLNASVVVRTRSELKRIAKEHPFAAEGVGNTSLHVMFLAAAPTSKATGSLDPDRSPPDRFVVKGREIYLLFPKGSGRSKLTIDYFERQLGTRATARNWNTVQKLLEMMEES